jgi:hypothetical protein
MKFPNTVEAVEMIEKEMALLTESASYVDKYVLPRIESEKEDNNGSNGEMRPMWRNEARGDTRI